MLFAPRSWKSSFSKVQSSIQLRSLCVYNFMFANISSHTSKPWYLSANPPVIKFLLIKLSGENWWRGNVATSNPCNDTLSALLGVNLGLSVMNRMFMSIFVICIIQIISMNTYEVKQSNIIWEFRWCTKHWCHVSGINKYSLLVPPLFFYLLFAYIQVWLSFCGTL